MKKLIVYCLVFIVWCNTGWANDNNDDLTDNQIKKILKKNDRSTKNRRISAMCRDC